MSRLLNPALAGMRLSMLLHLYRLRLRSHAVQELLAGSGIAVGVALVLGVLIANQSLTGSTGQLIHEAVGVARLQLAARSPDGIAQSVVGDVRRLPGVRAAVPALRENVALVGPRGRESLQLLGVSPSALQIGGFRSAELSRGHVRLGRGLVLPAGVAASIGAPPGAHVRVLAFGEARSASVGARLDGPGTLASAPIVIAPLALAQRLTGLRQRVTQVLVVPRPGALARVRSELLRVAGQRLDVVPAENELRLLDQAVGPNDQSTSLFAAIGVMVGFLLAVNAMLLTVPERRRFVADLRLQGYDRRQVLVLLAFQAGVLGTLASAVGIALGELLSHAFLQRVPVYLAAAFPVGSEQVTHLGTVLLALACGVLATVLASLSPAFDLRRGRAADAVFRDSGDRSEVLSRGTIARLAAAGAACVAGVCAVALLAPDTTIAGGVVLALATLLLIPGTFAALARALRWGGERVASSALIVVVSELRATTTRAVALAGIAGLAVYGSIAIGGARADLLRGLDGNFDEYLRTADVWVTTGDNDLATSSFRADGAAAAIARLPAVASVRVYQGGYLDVGRRRVWIVARPAGDAPMLAASQLLQGQRARATKLLRSGGWAAISSGFAAEHDLRLGAPFTLPTPSGPAPLRVAAITTNLGWPPGAIVLASADYARYWQTAEPSALEVTLRSGFTAAGGRRAVRAVLAGRADLGVQTFAERDARFAANSRDGLHALAAIAGLLLIAAALAVACALSAAIWQRRPRLASLKMQGYDSRQLWRALLLESAIVLAVGCVVGAASGILGHALASRWLRGNTGFPAPFAVGFGTVFLTLALLAAIALAVISWAGLAAARAPARASLQE